jgi:hypothetical protein
MNGRGWMGNALPLVFLVLGLGGCAGVGAGAGDGAASGGGTMLVVENNLAMPSSLTVYAVPEIGTRTLVGTVTSSANATLRFDPIGAGGQYRFVAQTTRGNELISNPVTFSPGATIRWNLAANRASVSGRN